MDIKQELLFHEKMEGEVPEVRAAGGWVDVADLIAEAWDEGARWAAVECGAIDDEAHPWLAPGDNPYRRGR